MLAMFHKTLLLMVLAFPSHAEEPSRNFCLDPKAAQQNEALARKHPQDEVIVKLVAMRAGLCDLLAKKIIDLDFAIELFDAEHAQGIQKRIGEEQTNQRQKGT
jgi:hypothetical protein